MKKILIILIFLFYSIFTYSNSAFSYSKSAYSVNMDFSIKVMIGLTKIEEKDNPRYKKFLDYIDENLAKKGEVKYSYKLNIDKRVVEFFSENNKILLIENLPQEFLNIIDNSINVAENKEEIKRTIKNIYENPYTHVSISKYKEKIILFTEEDMVNRGKIKNTMSVVLKRELSDIEKNELLLYLKDNNDDKFFNKYKTYIDSETTKTYINDKLELFQEIRGLTETTILYKKNEVSKEVLEYTDSSRLNAVSKVYKNDILLEETIFKNKNMVLEKKYYASGKLAIEIPMKDGLINGEVKEYYENGKIKATATFINGSVEGYVKEYNQAGKVIKKTLYKNGEKVK